MWLGHRHLRLRFRDPVDRNVARQRRVKQLLFITRPITLLQLASICRAWSCILKSPSLLSEGPLPMG
jgi:hypothetical protein